jgi:hypothetical protein
MGLVAMQDDAKGDPQSGMFIGSSRMTRAQFRELVDDLKRRNASPAPFVEALDLIAQVDPALTSVQKILRYADIMEGAEAARGCFLPRARRGKAKGRFCRSDTCDLAGVALLIGKAD